MSTLATRVGQEIKSVRTEMGDIATELEMQEGTSTDVKRMSPALVKAAITENAPPAPVTSVAGKTGGVVLTASDVGAAASSHNHSAANITSGTLAGARLPNATSNVQGAVKVRLNGTTAYFTNNGNNA